MKILLILLIAYFLVSVACFLFFLAQGSKVKDAAKDSLLWLPFLIVAFCGGFHVV